MSLRAVTDAIHSAINGQSYGSFEPLAAHREYPSIAKAGETPHAFIWASGGREIRQSAPRHTGNKEVRHSMRIYLISIFRPQTKAPMLSIRDLTMGVMDSLAAVAIPQIVTDTITGEQSQLMDILENAHWEIPNQRTSALYRLTANHSMIEVDALEILPG